MPETGFSKRINTACDGHPHAPPYGRGRQTWIKEQLGVSHEAVRKWFSGEARPRPDKMRELARTLEVDEAWLALGIKPDLEPAERRVRNAVAEGAVNHFMGIVQMNGGHVAFPDPKDPRAAFVDFYAIMRGVQMAFHVSLAQRLSAGQYRFTLPKEFEQCTIIGAVHISAMAVHFIRMPFESLDAHKIRKGGYYEVMVSKQENNYITGEDVWPRITSFANIG